MKQDITQHEGQKYLRTIRDAIYPDQMIQVDVYAVLKAFNVVDAPIAHAVKKLLCAGQRGKGDKVADLHGVLAAVNRAIDLENEELVASQQAEEDAMPDPREKYNVPPFMRALCDVSGHYHYEPQQVADLMIDWMAHTSTTLHRLKEMANCGEPLSDDCPIVFLQLDVASEAILMRMLAPVEVPAPDPKLDAEPHAEKCQIPPAGWYCTREVGHPGPCAAHPVIDHESFMRP